MRYKVGDKVRIKTWEYMKREYCLISKGNFIKHYSSSCELIFTSYSERVLNRDKRNRILTIQEISEHQWTQTNSYLTQEMPRQFVIADWIIECLVEKYVEPIPIYSRFEILDL